jgi:hypothetical protein
MLWAAALKFASLSLWMSDMRRIAKGNLGKSQEEVSLGFLRAR